MDSASEFSFSIAVVGDAGDEWVIDFPINDFRKYLQELVGNPLTGMRLTEARTIRARGTIRWGISRPLI